MSISMFITFCEYKCQDLDPKSCYRDYEKDNFSKKLGFKSYTEYMEHMIDMIIDQQEPISSIIDDGVNTVMNDACPCVNSHPFVFPKHLSELSDAVVSDFNDIHKTKGFLAKASTDFTFCGPDRESRVMNTLQDYIYMAKAISSTKLPNYKFEGFLSPQI